MDNDYTQEDYNEFELHTSLFKEVKDKNVRSVMIKMSDRARVGLNKYGVTTERNDLNFLQWLTHAQEEAMDLAVYLERIKQDLSRRISDGK